MALPISRTQSASPGDAVSSALLNDIQDQIIALFNGMRAPLAIPIPLANGQQIDASFIVAGSDFTKTFDVGVGVSTPGSTTFYAVPFPRLPVGMRIADFSFYINSKSGGGNLRCWLMRVARDSSLPAQLSGDVIGTAVGEVVASNFAPAPPWVVAADYNYFFHFEFPNEAVSISYLEAVVDRP